MRVPWPVTPTNRTSPSSRACQGVDGAAGAVRHLPFVRLDQVVELDQVDRLDPQPPERPLQLGAGGIAAPLTGLGGEEELLPVPGIQADPQLGVAVAGGHVDVVHPVGEEHLEQLVGPILAHRPQRCGTEDHAAADVPRAPNSACGITPTTLPVAGRQPDRCVLAAGQVAPARYPPASAPSAARRGATDLRRAPPALTGT